MSTVEKYLGESQVKGSLTKKLLLKINSSKIASIVSDAIDGIKSVLGYYEQSDGDRGIQLERYDVIKDDEVVGKINIDSNDQLEISSTNGINIKDSGDNGVDITTDKVKLNADTVVNGDSFEVYSLNEGRALMRVNSGKLTVRTNEVGIYSYDSDGNKLQRISTSEDEVKLRISGTSHISITDEDITIVSPSVEYIKKYTAADGSVHDVTYNLDDAFVTNYGYYTLLGNIMLYNYQNNTIMGPISINTSKNRLDRNGILMLPYYESDTMVLPYGAYIYFYINSVNGLVTSNVLQEASSDAYSITSLSNFTITPTRVAYSTVNNTTMALVSYDENSSIAMGDTGYIYWFKYVTPYRIVPPSITGISDTGSTLTYDTYGIIGIAITLPYDSEDALSIKQFSRYRNGVSLADDDEFEDMFTLSYMGNYMWALDSKRNIIGNEIPQIYCVMGSYTYSFLDAYGSEGEFNVSLGTII